MTIEEFDTDDLSEEFESRGFEVFRTEDVPPELEEIDDESLIDELQDRRYVIYKDPQKFPPQISLSTNNEWREHITSLLQVPYMSDVEFIINLLRVKLL